ncbi:MAG: zinc-binding alcohol dehydrogenase family protein [Acidobacteriota bacterium]|nr:zinc-binding alcohol dehydrogenase family protein [Acidobacteriota bacterium]
MKAIGFSTSLPIDDPASLLELDTEAPVPGPHDLLVRVRAVSINPVDVKQRQRAAMGVNLPSPRILGFDASGTVEAVGSEVHLFRAGDAVWYAGSVKRPGTNAELHLVDERIAGPKPATLGDAEAAAMPLTSLTAWEALFDRMHVPEGGGAGQTLLVVGGAGGVGSIAIQIAKQLTGLQVIATASREESASWCRELGADAIADHRDLLASVRSLGWRHVDYILCTNDFEGHWEALSELVAPEGVVCSILGAARLDVGKLMGKSATLTWELMFTRPSFETPRLIEQHHILARVAALIDVGRLRTTLRETLSGFTADNHKLAHRRVEAGNMIGKVAIRY